MVRTTKWLKTVGNIYIYQYNIILFKKLVFFLEGNFGEK